MSATTPINAPNAIAAQGPPHPMRGLLPYEWTLLDYAWLLGAALVLCAALAAAIWVGRWLWHRHKRKRGMPSMPTDPIAAVTAALHAHLPPVPFVAEAQAEYFWRLTLLFREFLEHRFRFGATDLTTRELRQKLETVLPDYRDVRREMLEFFDRADAVKFAKSPSDEAEARRLHGYAIGWVQRYRPLPPEVFTGRSQKGSTP